MHRSTSENQTFPHRQKPQKITAPSTPRHSNTAQQQKKQYQIRVPDSGTGLLFVPIAVLTIFLKIVPNYKSDIFLGNTSKNWWARDWKAFTLFFVQGQPKSWRPFFMLSWALVTSRFGESQEIGKLIVISSAYLAKEHSSISTLLREPMMTENKKGPKIEVIWRSWLQTLPIFTWCILLSR